MTNDIDTLGITLKNVRNALEMTQEQLAEHLDVSTRYIMQIENGHKKPSYKLF